MAALLPNKPVALSFTVPSLLSVNGVAATYITNNCKYKNFIDSVKQLVRLKLLMSEDKKVPNPFGRKGGLEHQAKVEEVTEEIRARGFQAVKEQILRFLGIKKYRYADVVAVDNREIIEIHQIGKETMSGNPIKREQIVIDEIRKELGISVNFHPYNREENNE